MCCYVYEDKWGFYLTQTYIILRLYADAVVFISDKQEHRYLLLWLCAIFAI